MIAQPETTALTVIPETPQRGLTQWQVLQQQAQAISDSGLYAKSVYNRQTQRWDTVNRPPEEIIAIGLAGQDYDLSLSMSMRRIMVIKGQVTMSAELMRGLARRGGYDWDIVEVTPERCTFHIWKASSPENGFTYTYTMQMAQRAELLKGPNEKPGSYEKFPEAMMVAGASRNAIRAYAPEVLLQAYTPDEIGEEVASEDIEAWERRKAVARVLDAQVEPEVATPPPILAEDPDLEATEEGEAADPEADPFAEGNGKGTTPKRLDIEYQQTVGKSPAPSPEPQPGFAADGTAVSAEGVVAVAGEGMDPEEARLQLEADLLEPPEATDAENAAIRSEGSLRGAIAKAHCIGQKAHRALVETLYPGKDVGDLFREGSDENQRIAVLRLARRRAGR